MIEISKGISLFNEAEFFSAHDFFEDCWVICDREERLFFQGMVQISVGCFHLLSGNYKGSLSQFLKGTKKLRNFNPSYREIKIDKLLIEIDVLIKSISENSIIEDPKKIWKLIPKIELNS
ncbi:MAG: DUF309 domain-containing protein [Ignavibacteriales bacterium]|nr:DUF309 domain-containing protein [Ignavibacteriales bacterium]